MAELDLAERAHAEQHGARAREADRVVEHEGERARPQLAQVAQRVEQLQMQRARRRAALQRSQERRAEAERRIQAMRERLALVRVESDPPGAAIYVDRKELGSHGLTPRTIVVPEGELAEGYQVAFDAGKRAVLGDEEPKKGHEVIVREAHEVEYDELDPSVASTGYIGPQNDNGLPFVRPFDDGSADGAVKLGDFGMAKLRTSIQTITGSMGTPAWMAPEVVLPCHWEPSADVYSVGVCLWETLTEEEPYHECSSPVQIIGLKLQQALPKPFPPPGPLALVQLTAQCLQGDPHARPSSEQLLAQLQAFVGDM